jgi:ATP-dependent Clp protease ATP-binding subunit ClpA
MKKELKALEATIGVRGVGLKVSDQAIKILVEQCLKGEENARLVRRLLQEKIEAPLARSLLSGGSGKKRLFKVDVKKGDLAYNMK